jgi:hypothetical protein
VFELAKMVEALDRAATVIGPKSISLSKSCLSKQPYGREALCVETDLLYDGFGSHCMSKAEASNFLLMT